MDFIKYKKRYLEESILELFEYYPVIAVLGARQVGKSTLIDNLFDNELHQIVFDPVIDIGNAREDPEFFLQNIRCPAFLDEVQYAPELLGTIKRRVDKEKKNGMYILSGSQNLSVLKSISESLAGRVSILNLWPMTRRELEEEEKPSFLRQWVLENNDEIENLPKPPVLPVLPLIWRGGYPGIIEFPDRLIPGYWQSYLQTYIERDIRTVANIGSLQTFGNFMGLLAALSGQEINHMQLGRELGIDRKTALAWTEIAQATYQWISIPAFSRNAVKKIAGKSKGYFTDTGFICYLQRIGSPEALQNHPLKGSLFETYIIMEIVKSFQDWPISPNLYHFRTYSGAEVDLILELNGVLYPIEIKMKSNPSKRDVKGFESFKACFPTENIRKGLLICSSETIQPLSEEVIAVPWTLL